MSAPAPSRTVYAVSELADTLRGLIEDALPRVWVQGEISNFSRPASGHWYFTLKDARAQLRCAMFRNTNFHVRPQPRDGDQVLVRAQISLYTARGDLQLICEHMEPAGEGALLRAYEELKKRLAAEGLFDERDKRPLPRWPRAIGVITSGTGAAIQDITSTLARRYPLAPVYLYPVPVQGAEAPGAIVKALRELPTRAPVDVVLLARGGGSLEDLWGFNDEAVARAIRACAVPVVSGVGHEVDVTIADFAADLRAPTPTGAAERVAPDLAETRADIAQLRHRLQLAQQRQLRDASDTLQTLSGRIQRQHPQRQLQERAQRLDESAARTQQAMQQQLRHTRRHLSQLQSRLQAHAPTAALQLRHAQSDALQQRLQTAMLRQLDTARADWRQQQSMLDNLNPRAVLQRGYAIALDADGNAVTDAAQLRANDSLNLQFARGGADVDVRRILPPTADPDT